jgi:peptidoglycan hydrolase-like protein with peptidoglycan-binding domain
MRCSRRRWPASTGRPGSFPPELRFAERVLQEVDVLLKRGSSGDNVTKLQKGLSRIGFDPGEIDGVYGPHTEAAVKELQRAAGLAVDGIYGPDTRAALRERRSEAKAAKAEKKAAKAAKKAAKAAEAAQPAEGPDTGAGTIPM